IIIFIFILLIQSSLLFAVEITGVTYTWIANNPTYDKDLSGQINIGDDIKFTITLNMWVSNINIATIDIGTLYQNVQLYNDGLGTHGDGIPNDNKYNVYWTVNEGTSVFAASVLGNYWDAGVKKSFFSPLTLTFDAERPVINNIDLAPNAFNPYIENCEISYTMNETVNNVVVKIYTNLLLTNEVKSLPKPPFEAGDNFITWWDGKKEDGQFVSIPPDSDYYVDISCRDFSGNYSISPTVNIKMSTIKMEIVGFDMSPHEVSPDGDGVDDNVYFNTKIMMYSWDGVNITGLTTNQMKIVGLLAGSDYAFNAQYADGDKVWTWPYAKTGFIIYDALGVKKEEYGQDLDASVDYDQWFATKLSNELGSYPPDGETANDYETLVPLYDDGIGGHELDYGGGASQFGDGIFTTGHSFYVHLFGEWTDGVYIVRAGVELTGLDYHISPSSPPSIHFLPDWKGGFITAELVQSTFVVNVSGPGGVDSVPPHVVSVYPESGSTISYNLTSAVAFLEDNTGGSGIDLLASDIYVTDENGSRVAGRKLNNATDVLMWEFDKRLDVKGNYTIHVNPVDRRGNQPPAYETFQFTLDVIGDTSSLITVIGGGTALDNRGKVYLSVPPYSVEQDMRITAYQPFSFPGDEQVINGCQFMPATVSFKRPVQMTLYYAELDKAKIPAGLSESSLRIYNWAVNKWEYIGGNVNTDTMSVTVSGIRKIDGFYAILPDTVGGLPLDVIADVQVDKPFRENGYISFKISGAITSLKLLMYTMSGSFIKEVPINMSSINNAGYYDVSWDLVSGNDAIVNNGIYIFRFIAQRADGQRKIVSKAIPVIK
ncbi:MAG: hypothetical protein KKH98_02880, partial [Spirochaetes bacterium]|nr:hypothetical protein [Spirochaetota bacterium]